MLSEIPESEEQGQQPALTIKSRKEQKADWIEAVPRENGMNILVDGLGVIGIVSTFIIYQQKERRKLLIWKLITDLIWISHYIALGAYSAVAATVVAILRTVVFLNEDRKWAQSKAWLPIFLAISLTFSIFAWQDIFSLGTTLSSLSAIIAYWMKKPKVTRAISIPSAVAYLIYTIHAGSIEGSVNEIFIIVSSIIGYIRLDREKKKAAA